SLEELLKESDFVSIHAPYTQDTHHLIGKEQLELMKPTAYLINTSRGRLVNEEELVIALQEGKIAGAGLDVFYDEPRINKELIKFPNVVLLPHIGSASLETRTKMAIIAAENMVEALQGKRPRNIINPEIYD
ncbi:MAG: NAD(P)-dependent oxidoreductase, partial [Candidatus Heimdallarchaeota archaeon]